MNDDVEEIRLWNDKNTSTGVGAVLNSNVQKLLGVSLAVTMEKIRDAARRETVVALLTIFHCQQFSQALFKGLVKWSRDCEGIIKALINENNYVQ